MKKLLAIMMAAVLAVGLVGCGNAASPAASQAESQAASQASSAVSAVSEALDGKDPADCKIGVIQLTEHVALDAARDGFIDGLVEAGYSLDNIDVQSAQGEIPNCATIATKFVNDNVDLILAIATPAAQAAAQATSDIPIIATAVTDFEVAGLVASNDAPGGNVTGTSDMNPIAEQAKLLQTLVPDAQNVAIVYCSAEDNSVLQAELAKAEFESLGLTANEYTAADINDVQSIMTKAVGEADVIYIPTDNLFAGNMPTVALVAEPAGIPVICGESGMVESGGTASLGIDYYTLGQMSAGQAVEILQLGINPAEMPVLFASLEDLDFVANEENCKAIGLTIPADLAA